MPLIQQILILVNRDLILQGRGWILVVKYVILDVLDDLYQAANAIDKQNWMCLLRISARIGCPFRISCHDHSLRRFRYLGNTKSRRFHEDVEEMATNCEP